MRLLPLFCLAGALCAQDITRTPDVRGYQGKGMVSRAIWKYLPRDMPHTQFYNSNRLESLMRAGNIYLSLQDAIALALENNLDIEYHRYDRRQAETDQLRASAGQLLRFSGNPARAGFNSAASGVLGGLGALGGSGGGGRAAIPASSAASTFRASAPASPTWKPMPSPAGRPPTTPASSPATPPPEPTTS